MEEHFLNKEQIISKKKTQKRKEEKAESATWQEGGWATDCFHVAGSSEGYSGPEESFHMCLIAAENPWRILQGRESQVDSRFWKCALRVQTGFGSGWRARLEAGRPEARDCVPRALCYPKHLSSVTPPITQESEGKHLLWECLGSMNS